MVGSPKPLTPELMLTIQAGLKALQCLACAEENEADVRPSPQGGLWLNIRQPLKPEHMLIVQAGLKALQCLAFAEEDEADMGPVAGGGGARGGGRCSGELAQKLCSIC